MKEWLKYLLIPPFTQQNEPVKLMSPQHIHFSKSETILRWMGKGPVGGNGLPVSLFKCPVAVGPDYIVRHVVLSTGTRRGMGRFWYSAETRKSRANVLRPKKPLSGVWWEISFMVRQKHSIARKLPLALMSSSLHLKSSHYFIPPPKLFLSRTHLI